MSAAPVLEIRGLHAGYGDVEVLHGIELAVSAGELVALLGANGAGKTTTLRTVAGLCAPRAGEILFLGEPLSRVPAAARAGLGMALVPEGRELWPQLSVEENLQLGAYAPAARARAQRNLELVHALFPRLLERRRQLAGSLSGGEQQMCAIGRALMSEPRLLMLDEPSLGLAPIVVDQVFRALAELHAGGMTVLLVEQNLRKALELAQRGIVIETGQVKLGGTSAALLADPAIRAAYLGL
ncbi:MAG TPA: ABC transporter ATP-binding protein [Anaeromyxobacteraceae bacterium]